jgi:ubiquinone/menaquinone biosynthesis C-methylase UbiE
MSVRRRFFQFYFKLKGVIAPSLRHPQAFYGDAIKESIRPGVSWLDLGCGHQVLPSWCGVDDQELVKPAKHFIGFDYDLEALKAHQSLSMRARAEISHLPLRDGCVDVVTANMVVEHLDAPDVQFREISRVLKPGGVFLFHTPNVLGYTTMLGRIVPEAVKAKVIRFFEGREEEDVFRTHYKANSVGSITDLAAETGFEVAEIRLLAPEAQFVMIPPFVIFELAVIRLLMTSALRSYRTNLVVTLKKTG